MENEDTEKNESEEIDCDSCPKKPSLAWIPLGGVLMVLPIFTFEYFMDEFSTWYERIGFFAPIVLAGFTGLLLIYTVLKERKL